MCTRGVYVSDIGDERLEADDDELKGGGVSVAFIQSAHVLCTYDQSRLYSTLATRFRSQLKALTEVKYVLFIGCERL